MKKIAIFNHKGGVSKTTTAFNIGWKLSRDNKKVLLVDADSQCNLTMMFLGNKEFDKFIESGNTNNIMDALSPAFKGKPRPVDAIDCIQNRRNKNLFLLPGNLDLTSYEVALAMSFNFSNTLGVTGNLPGAFSYLIDKCGEKYELDYAIIDMNPSLSAINQDLILSSDYFVIPSSPDIFSLKAIQSLSRVLPKWETWACQARTVFKDADYPFSPNTPKFIGYTINDFNLGDKAQPTNSFKTIMNRISKEVTTVLVPALGNCNMLLANELYDNATEQNNKIASQKGNLDKYCLGQISNFNKLIAESNRTSVPIFELQLNKGYAGQKRTLQWFKRLFGVMAQKIIILTNE